MILGWVYLEDSDPLPALGSAAFLDVAGAAAGLRSAEKLVRLMYTGRPDVSDLAARAAHWAGQGCRVQLGNEPNNPGEGFGGTPADYLACYKAVKALCPGVRLYWAAPSPGFVGWEDWYDGAEIADGLTVHAYGTFGQMRSIVEAVLHRFPGKPIWVSECNYGPRAGVVVDVGAWARGHLRPFLDWCAGQEQIEAVSYFAYRWPSPDMAEGTPVDGAGTEIEAIIRSWRGKDAMVDDSGIVALQAQVSEVLAQNALLTQALRALREGKFTGADGIDGLIVALQGGRALDFEASWPGTASTDGGTDKRMGSGGPVVLDAEGFDIGPLASAAAGKYGIPLVGLLAMLKAESGLRRTASRLGSWPDVSFGYCQMTVATAAGYGIGDGSGNDVNIAAVAAGLIDRAAAIDVGAHHLSGCYGAADAQGYAAQGLSHDLAALVVYNAGHLPAAGDPWWVRWAGNVANYKAALAWAQTILG